MRCVLFDYIICVAIISLVHSQSHVHSLARFRTNFGYFLTCPKPSLIGLSRNAMNPIVVFTLLLLIGIY